MPAEGAHPWIARNRNATYKRISTGTLFVCIGAILLLNIVGRLGADVWFDLIRLWPVLLISMGIRWVFVKTPVHPLALLGPACVIAATGFVAWEGRRDATEGTWDAAGTMPIACPASAQGGRPSRMTLGFDSGRLAFTAVPPEGPEAVGSGKGAAARGGKGRGGFDGSLRYEGEKPKRACDAGALRLERGGAAAGLRLIAPLWSRRWEARIAAGAPVQMNARITGATASLDLRGFSLHAVDLRATGARVTIRLDAPERIVPLRLDGAASSLQVVVPPGTCWRLSRRPMLNVVSAKGAGRQRFNAHRVVSPACGADGASPEYVIDFDLPFAAVSVTTEGRGA